MTIVATDVNNKSSPYIKSLDQNTDQILVFHKSNMQRKPEKDFLLNLSI